MIKMIGCLFLLGIVMKAQVLKTITPVEKNTSVQQTGGVRNIKDSIGFSWNPVEMDELIKLLGLLDAQADRVVTYSSSKGYDLVAAISPHDDFLYAGKTYFPLFQKINAKEVVIFGVTHATVRKEIGDPSDIIILDRFDRWKGTYSDVEISPLREKIKEELDPDYFRVDNKAHSLEHSIEAVIPFLQYYNKSVKITPIMVTRSNFNHLDTLSDALASVIEKYIKENNLTPGKDIFFLISNDANHYGEDFNNSPYGLDESAHTKAVLRDKEIARNAFSDLLTKDKVSALSDELFPDPAKDKIYPVWCGRYAMIFGLLTTSKVIKSITGEDLQSQFMGYSDSWTTGILPAKRVQMGITAPFSLKHWVGYLSAGFWINK